MGDVYGQYVVVFISSTLSLCMCKSFVHLVEWPCFALNKTGMFTDSKSLVLTSSNVAAPAVATSAYHHHHNHHHYNNGGPYATGAGYGTGTSSFYGAAAAASAGGYYPLSSSLKTGGTYPLAPYFGSATTPPAYYGKWQLQQFAYNSNIFRQHLSIVGHSRLQYL